MTDFPIVTSVQNPQIKAAVKLRKKRDRDLSQTFLIEGYRELFRGLDAGIRPTTLYICPEFYLGSNEPSLIQRCLDVGCAVIECSKQVFEKLSYRDRPDGLLGIAPQLKHSLSALEESLANSKTAPLLVIAESIEKPGNLGTILRSADAAGADAVIVCDRCTDIHNPNVVRASTGTLFTRPVLEVSSEELIPWLKQLGVSIFAATPSASLTFTNASMKEAAAIVVGTEQYGLSDQWLKDPAMVPVRIPMMGCADSLNVAQATTLLLFEALRQRS